MKISRFLGELIGTAVILIAVVGSSFMAQDLGADWALGLLINAAVTASILAIVIKSFYDISGSHFNPAVSLALLIGRKISFRSFMPYVAAQLVGSYIGVFIANVMFSRKLLVNSQIDRAGIATGVGELVATLGLLLLAVYASAKLVWKFVPLWIFAAYFFTSSTSFANPAVTFARVWTESLAGISPSSALVFIILQLLCGITVGISLRQRRSE